MRPIVILGPTAGGKSDLAVALAERFHGEILGADSMQIYRHMDAGTAKPSAEQRRRAPHHLIDLVEPTERFTVANWLERADSLIQDLVARHRTPIVVGGTNLYIKALLEGLFDGPPMDQAFRAALANVPAPELHARLMAIDPRAAERIHMNDHKRLTRALEVHHVTGTPISAWQTQWSDSVDPNSEPQVSSQVAYRHDPLLLGLHWPADTINRRINARVKAMFFPESAGLTCESLPNEVQRLESAGLLGPQARQALGYKQVLDHLAGPCSLDDAFEQTKILTRRFAKTQRTWFKRFRNVHWLPGEAEDLASQAADVVASP